MLAKLRARYEQFAHWLHTRWPAGTVERLPVCDEHGRTNVPGVFIVGDLTGVPLLKFAGDTGARAAQLVAKDLSPLTSRHPSSAILDLAIIGGGVAGIAAAVEAKRAGLRFVVFESAEAFSTIANFPKAKPIFTYPTEMKPAGGLDFTADVKESLLAELETQRAAAGIEITPARIERIERRDGALLVHHAGGEITHALRVIVAIGRSGDFRKLGVPGGEQDKVSNRLHDPADFAARDVLVIGGGDSALEAAVALAESGARVTLSHRGAEFSRPKPENIARLAASSATVRHGTRVARIDTATATLRDEAGREDTLKNDAVFSLIGRDAPLGFFRRSGIAIRGEWSARTWISFVLFAIFTIWLYHWKSGKGPLADLGKGIPDFLASLLATIGIAADDPRTITGSIVAAAKGAGFYYALAYSVLIIVFGFRRIARRRTPYVTAQTLSLMAVQVVPLFILPAILLPWLGTNGAFDSGFWKSFADQFFPGADTASREYWRACGFILAWPLFIWNVFTDTPTAGWLIVSLVQTFVIIPLIVWRWGKGAYCGWICSCGALAETLGDTHRHKMPHGPRANRWNMAGQIILAIAMLLLVLRIFAWVARAVPALGFLGIGNSIYYGLLSGWPVLNYAYFVDLWLAGVLGVGAYFWFSGRVWCRFACPLAALMHIYARFSQFRIFAEKKKCISCNVCTSVCHQGIDVMNFANKGLAMEDPECVRCSACVQSCPTGVLAFGRIEGGVPLLDRLAASPVRMREEN